MKNTPPTPKTSDFLENHTFFHKLPEVLGNYKVQIMSLFDIFHFSRRGVHLRMRNRPVFRPEPRLLVLENLQKHVFAQNVILSSLSNSFLPSGTPFRGSPL
jgi:hypothetical protein